MRDDGLLVVDLGCVLAHTPEVLDDRSPVEFVGIRSTAFRRLCELEQVRYCGPSILDLISFLYLRCLLLLQFLLFITQHSSTNALECVLAFKGWGRERYR